MSKQTKTPRKPSPLQRGDAAKRRGQGDEKKETKTPTMRNVDAWITFTIGRKKVVLTIEQSGKTITGAIIVNGRVTNEYKRELPLEVPDDVIDFLNQNGIKL